MPISDPSPAAPCHPERVVCDETIPAGAYWTRVIPRWSTLRITDLEGAGGAALLAYNAEERSERYNAPDTTKVQNMVYLTEGFLLLSDLGRVLFSITADTGSGLETLTGGTTASTVSQRYGAAGTYLARRNDRYTNDRDNFIAALGRHGLDKRALVANVNLFARVEIETDGALRYASRPEPGAYVELRAELDVLVAVSATPHVLNPSSVWTAGPLRFTVWDTPPPGADDHCRTRSLEATRAFENTDDYWAQRPGRAA